MRLIDADALRKQISETYEYEFPTASGAFDEFVTKIIPNIINNAPTIDAVPVVRGEWYQCSAFDEDENVYTCSVCGEPWVLIDGTPPENNMNFCPNCGADMRGET